MKQELTPGSTRKARDTLAQVASQGDAELYFNIQYYRYQMLARLLPTLAAPPAQVLDVGATPGHVSKIAAQLGFPVIALDFNPDEDLYHRGQSLREELRSYGCVVKQCDIQTEDFPVEEGSVNIAIFTEVLEHIWLYPQRPIIEIFRCLAPGGYLIITTPNVAKAINRARLLINRNIYNSMDSMLSLPVFARHSREYTLSEVVMLVERCGFRVETADYRDFSTWITRIKGPGTQRRYLRTFRPNSTRQVAKLMAHILGYALPSIRDSIFLIARKE